jgi:predicted PurR-regulated permease PerM
MSRIVSLIALVTIVVLVGVLSFKVMASFLLPMFLALVLTVIFRPLHKWFISRCQGYDRVAAGLTTASILLIVLLPTALILTRAAAEAYTLVTEIDPEQARERLKMLRQKFDLEAAASPEDMDHVNDFFKSFKNLMDQLEAQVAQPEGNQDPVILRTELRNAAQQIHDGLHIGSEMPKDQVSPETRALITERWGALNERLQAIESTEPRTPEFDAAVGNLNPAFVAFRESVQGSPVVQFTRGQLNPDPKQIEEWLTKARDFLTGLAVGTGQFLGGVFVGLGVMIISLYYFMADGPAMIRALMHLSPLDDRYEEELLNEFTTISRAVVLATLLSAFAQGLLASIGYFFAGFESVFLLTVITMFLALIPFVGAAAVWGACSVWLLFNNQTTAAICLALYGGLVVSMIDNLIKPMVLHGQSKLHPLLALLSILGGIKALGPIGIFVGPMGVGFLQALLNMLHNELVALDDPSEPPAGKLPPPPAATGLPAAPT